ncbi:hypothetical protein F2P81_003970 [Scophthalmus maximus]|uniref:Uncharacterized protein n=1 Tax=Scophthalmus maximus TaxID=52904 RepID=A0A6A4TRZ4_SCOMX|nr:hypothetical protein F2P81_003970 [Scophthalmus maximus]
MGPNSHAFAKRTVKKRMGKPEQTSPGPVHPGRLCSDVCEILFSIHKIKTEEKKPAVSAVQMLPLNIFFAVDFRNVHNSHQVQAKCARFSSTVSTSSSAPVQFPITPAVELDRKYGKCVRTCHR